MSLRHRAFRLSGLISAVLFPAASLAADMSPAPLRMPVADAPLRAPPPSSFSCYAGLSGGANILSYDFRTISTPDGLPPVGSIVNHKATATGALLGAQAGCNRFFSAFMLGAEVSGWLTPGKPPEDCNSLTDPMRDCLRLKEGPGVGAAVRGGYVVGPALLFAKIGVAYVSTRVAVDYHRVKIKGNTPTEADPWQYEEKHSRSGSVSEAGLMLGFGAEYRISESWSTRLEYESIITRGTSFTTTVGTGGFVCSNNGGSSYPCGGDTNLSTAGKLAQQFMKLGRSRIRLGINRSF